MCAIQIRYDFWILDRGFSEPAILHKKRIVGKASIGEHDYLRDIYKIS